MSTADLLEDIRKDWAPFAEVQSALNCSRSKVSRYIASGVFVSRKLGKEQWISRESIKRYLDSVFAAEQPRPVRPLKRK